MRRLGQQSATLRPCRDAARLQEELGAHRLCNAWRQEVKHRRIWWASGAVIAIGTCVAVYSTRLEPPSYVYVKPASSKLLREDDYAKKKLHDVVVRIHDQYNAWGGWYMDGAKAHAPHWKAIMMATRDSALGELAAIVACYPDSESAVTAKLLMASMLIWTTIGREPDVVPYGRTAAKRILQEIVDEYPHTLDAGVAQALLAEKHARKQLAPEVLEQLYPAAEAWDLCHEDLLEYLQPMGLGYKGGFRASLELSVHSIKQTLLEREKRR